MKNSAQIYQKRLQKIQNVLKKEETSFFISDPYNVFYLSGFKGSNGQILTLPNKTFLITDFRYKQQAENLSKTLKIKTLIPKNPLAEEINTLFQKNKIRLVYFEEKQLTFQKYRYFKKTLLSVNFQPSNNIVEKYRQQKDQLEISLIEKAQKITDLTFQQVKNNLKFDMTELDIAWEIEKIGRELGADDISFAPIVAFNEHSAIPHHQPTTKKLRKGDVILIDMGMKYQNYCSDMTRMIFTKKPTVLQLKVYQTVLEAQLKAEQKVKTNADCSEIDLTARHIIEKAGFQGKFGHSLGHGIGLEVHESPNLSPHYKGKLIKNNIVTIEPGIYLENNFGVRIEDMVLIESKGSRNLTETPKKIEDCLLKI